LYAPTCSRSTWRSPAAPTSTWRAARCCTPSLTSGGRRDADWSPKAIETEQELAAVAGCGVELAQGYFLARPSAQPSWTGYPAIV